MNIDIAIGNRKEKINVPEKNLLEVIEQNTAFFDSSKSDGDIIKCALDNPIGALRLSKIVKPSEKVAIITSDITRPMPSKIVLQYVLDEIYKAGVKPCDITIVFAIGSHRHQSEEERRKLVGNEIFNNILCVDSDPDNCINLGRTTHGTPVDITATVAEADRRICIGNIEFHYFAGYSGGVKAMMPGTSSKLAIQSNHSLMIEENACAGNVNSPVRKDLEETEKFCKIDFILNVVLDEHKEIVYAVAGDFIAAHREGCKFLDKLYRKTIKECADIVIVSQGGAPKDLNFYQTQKALDNAKYAVKKDGTIILVGSCKEGFGEKTFENWMLEAKAPKDLIERVKINFELGGHKAAAIAMVMEKATIKLVSESGPDLATKSFMQHYESVQKALDDAFCEQGKDATVIVMPYGGSTLPHIMEKK